MPTILVSIEFIGPPQCVSASPILMCYIHAFQSGSTMFPVTKPTLRAVVA